ncbi:gluconate 2-dehydrogenase subunit 3 family protein [Spirosoma rhododendri]|uniref:Gluconate 2-dehydrogenase subunit 3 family protein n=1 Tax=Spirosoma rhododendri TaxID=2728024 RepID=A0A7L5DVG2_9BACT|nr:gluconate 2-dehydrogenase subunit 3 family protein [Spirosoma rhododendri]
MAGAVGGLIALPGWASGWTAESVRLATPLLPADQVETLAAVVDTIIPATDTPGAKDLNVQQFIQKVVADCYDKPTQDMLSNGLVLTNDLAQKTFGKPFNAGDATQRVTLLKQLEQSTDPAQAAFIKLVKPLTIRGYLNSEYVMTNLTHYEFIPGHYNGCVPVKK